MTRWPALALLPCLLIGGLAQAQATRATPAAAKRAAAAAALAPASPEQLEAAERVYYGPHDCADGPGLDVGLDPSRPGYVDVRYGKTTYVMKPVMSTTGAVRLEDVKGGALLVQITAKSMLMDVQAGRRLADECISERHRQAMREAAPLAPAAAAEPAR